MRDRVDFFHTIQAFNNHLSALGFVRNGRTPTWRIQQNGRLWTLKLSRDRRTQYAGEVRTFRTLGYRLRIEVTTSTQTRLYLVRKGFASSGLVKWVYKIRNLTVLPLGASGIDDFQFVTRNPDWCDWFQRDEIITSSLQALMEYRRTAGASSSVYFEPGCLYFTSPRFELEDFSPTYIEQVLLNLNRMAQAAESLPSPSHPQKISRIQLLAKENPILATFALLGTLMSGCLISALLILGLIWILVK